MGARRRRPRKLTNRSGRGVPWQATPPLAGRSQRAAARPNGTCPSESLAGLIACLSRPRAMQAGPIFPEDISSSEYTSSLDRTHQGTSRLRV